MIRSKYILLFCFVFFFFVKTDVFALTTIGLDISTEGSLTVSGNVNLNDPSADTLWLGAAADTVTIAGDVSITDTQWSVSSAGALTTAGLITGTGGATMSGAAASINASSNFATNINTGTSTGALALGGGAGTVAVDSSVWDITAAGAMTGISAMTLVDLTATGNVTFNDASADTLLFGQNGATPDTVTLAGDVSVTDTQWAVTAAGAANFASLDSTVIGGTTPVAGTFTTLGTTGNTTLGDATTDRTTLNGELLMGSIGADPAGTNGLMYYSTGTDKFRCYAGGAWQNCGSDLSGSGASGRVTFWTGASTFSSSANLFWDGGQLGIGTATPSSTLHLASEGGATLILQRTNDGIPQSHIQFWGSDGGAGNYWDINTDSEVMDTFGVTRNGARVLTIATNGNVGIGTGEPTEQLEIYKIGGGSGIRIHSPGTVEYKVGIAVGDDKLRIVNSNGNAALAGNTAGIIMDNVGGVVFGGAVATGGVLTLAGGDINAFSNGVINLTKLFGSAGEDLAIQTGSTGSLTLKAHDVDDDIDTTFMTFTAANTPTLSITATTLRATSTARFDGALVKNYSGGTAGVVTFSADTTITAAQLTDTVSVFYHDSADNSARDLILPNAALVVAAVTNAAIGDTFKMQVANGINTVSIQSSADASSAMAAGITNTVAVGVTKTLTCTVTNVTGGTEAMTCY